VFYRKTNACDKEEHKENGDRNGVTTRGRKWPHEMKIEKLYSFVLCVT